MIEVHRFGNGDRCVRAVVLVHRIGIDGAGNGHKEAVFAERHILLLAAPIAVTVAIPNEPCIVIHFIAFRIAVFYGLRRRIIELIRRRMRHVADKAHQRRIALFQYGFAFFYFKRFRELSAVRLRQIFIRKEQLPRRRILRLAFLRIGLCIKVFHGVHVVIVNSAAQIQFHVHRLFQAGAQISGKIEIILVTEIDEHADLTVIAYLVVRRRVVIGNDM